MTEFMRVGLMVQISGKGHIAIPNFKDKKELGSCLMKHNLLKALAYYRNAEIQILD